MLSYLLVEDASFVDSTGAIFTLVLFVVLVRFLDVFFILVDMSCEENITLGACESDVNQTVLISELAFSFSFF